MSNTSSGDHRGGITFNGSIGEIKGPVVGGDYNITVARAEYAEAIDRSLLPLYQAIEAGPRDVHHWASEAVADIRAEAIKGTNADDGAIARLIDGLVGIVPAAAKAVVSAFATPVLQGLAGPVTSLLISKL